MSDQTTNVMANGETSGIRCPLEIQIKTRAINYWGKLLNGKPTKPSYIYSLLYRLHMNNIFTSDWIKFRKTPFDDSGISNIWSAQNPINPEWLKQKIYLTISDQYLQPWSQQIIDS